jgi:hypothetical protein
MLLRLLNSPRQAKTWADVLRVAGSVWRFMWRKATWENVTFHPALGLTQLKIQDLFNYGLVADKSCDTGRGLTFAHGSKPHHSLWTEEFSQNDLLGYTILPLLHNVNLRCGCS